MPADAWTADEMTAVWLSLKAATISTLVMLVPGVLLGWLLARKRFPGKVIVDAVCHLPLVLPPVVVGYMLLILLGRTGPIGRWLYEVAGVQLAFRPAAAVIAAAVMGFPLMLRSVRLAVEMVDPRYEQAATDLGASAGRVLWRVTIPLAAPGIVTGTLLAFARCLGEFGATITFAGNIAGQTRTLPLALYNLTQIPGGDARAARLVAVSVALSLAALLVSELLSRRIAARLGTR